MARRSEKREPPSWKLEQDSRGAVFQLRGAWGIDELEQIPPVSPMPLPSRITIDGSRLEYLDTCGAMAVYDLSRLLEGRGGRVSFTGFEEGRLVTLNLVRQRLAAFDAPVQIRKLSLIERIGKGALLSAEAGHAMLSFLGHCSTVFFRNLCKPLSFRLKEFVVQLEHSCIRGVPVVGLMMFLIGVVIAYLLAIQIQKYGANIFIVDGVGLAIFRELSPVVVAVIVAGRSGSAFTAQIGAMKLNEEVDALTTLGLSPMQVLVIPRVSALILSVPLLVFVGDLVGIAGGMVIAHNYLGIMPPTFLERLQSVLPIRHFYLGLIKAPVFAFFIGLIGCRMGLSVENNARSVGLNTTSTVVQSIVAIIILNALFAVIFAEMGL